MSYGERGPLGVRNGKHPLGKKADPELDRLIDYLTFQKAEDEIIQQIRDGQTLRGGMADHGPNYP